MQAYRVAAKSSPGLAAMISALRGEVGRRLAEQCASYEIKE